MDRRAWQTEQAHRPPSPHPRDVLSERRQTKRVRTLDTHQFTPMYSDRKQISGVQEGKDRREGCKGGNFGGAGWVCCLDQGDRFMGASIMAELNTLYASEKLL